jgi:hypothetical protein
MLLRMWCCDFVCSSLLDFYIAMFIYQCIEGIRARFLNFIIPVKSHELQQKIT